MFDLPLDRFQRRLCVDLVFCIAFVCGRRVTVLFAAERIKWPSADRERRQQSVSESPAALALQREWRLRRLDLAGFGASLELFKRLVGAAARH